MNRVHTLVTVLCSAVLLGGCETLGGGSGAAEDDGIGPPATVEERAGGASEEELARARGIGEGGSFSGDTLDDPANLLSKRTIYFDFDSSSLDAQVRRIVEAHGAYLAANPGTSVLLEGHADERGSREYNIALGERRAHAVRQVFTLLGSTPGQVQAVSYGEERPAAFGHDEASWRLNRRVEIIYER